MPQTFWTRIVSEISNHVNLRLDVIETLEPCQKITMSEVIFFYQASCHSVMLALPYSIIL